MAQAQSMNRRGARRTLLIATAAVVAAGIAAAVIASNRTAAPAALPVAQAQTEARATPAAVSPAQSSTAAPTQPRDALAAAADALGFRLTKAENVGLVENLPPDTTLMAPSKTLLRVGAAAPDFTLTTATGQRVRLSDFRGKTVLLEFFATWCPHCQAEAPHLINLHGTLPPSDFAFLSVNADSEDAASLYAFDRFFHIPWPTLLDPGTPAGSFKQAGGAGPVTDAYGVALYPTFYIIDPTGKVAWRNDREQPDMLLSMKLHEAAGK